jgi:hypothetical protein
VAFLALSAAALFGQYPVRPVPEGLEPVVSLGHELLGDSMLVFESAGVTLLATMIAVVMLTSHRGRYGEANHGSRPPGLEPGGDPADKPSESEEEGGHHHHHH